METGTTAESPADGSVPAYVSVTLSVLLILLPLGFWIPLAETGEATAGATWYRWVSMRLPLDLVWFVFAVMAIPIVIRRLRSANRSWGLIVMTSFAALSVVALVVNPSLLGTTFVARWIASIALVAVISGYPRSEYRTVVAAPLLVSGVIQAAIALWQHPGPGRGFAAYAGQSVSRGTLEHQVDLALFLLFVITVAVATLPARGRSRVVWIVSIGIMSAAIGGTLQRASAIALVLIWAAYGWGLVRDRSAYASALGASSIPFLVTVATTASGWLGRVAELTSGSVDRRSSGRVELMREALDLAREHPLLGAGPGRYIAELARLQPSAGGPRRVPVHLAPLLAAAELGFLGGALLVGTMIAFGWRAIRTSPAAVAVFASVAVYLLFEQRTYYIAPDVAVFAVWLATLDMLANRDRKPSPEAAS